MTLPRLCAPLALLAFAAAAAPAAADPIPLAYSPRAQDIALAGTDVIVARDTRRGGAIVDAVPIQGGPARRLLTAAGPGEEPVSFVTVAASPQRVAVVMETESLHRIETRLYTGPPTGPLHLDIRTGTKGFIPATTAVDGDQVLLLEQKLNPDISRARLLVPGSAPHTLPFRGDIDFPVELSAGRAAFVGTAKGADEPKLYVVDVATGAQQLAIRQLPTRIGFALAPDGHVVVENGIGLATVAPGQRRRQVPGSDFLGWPHVAGAGLVAARTTDVDGEQPVVLDPGATSARPLGFQTLDLAELATDDRNAAWLAHGCVLTAPLGSGPPPPEPPAGPCPRAEARANTSDGALRGRSVRLDVTCAAAPAPGCRGTVELRYFRTVGRARFHVRSGHSREVKVRLKRSFARLARKRVRKRGGLLFSSVTRVRGGGRPQHGIVFLERVGRTNRFVHGA